MIRTNHQQKFLYKTLILFDHKAAKSEFPRKFSATGFVLSENHVQVRKGAGKEGVLTTS